MFTKHNSDLPLIKEDEFLPPISRWTKFGGLFIVTVVALAIPVASIIKYKETIKAQASIRPEGKLRLVQAATEGQITSIAVKNNQVVKKGGVIAAIDDSILQTQKSQLRNSIQQSQLQLSQINTQINALNNQISAESDRLANIVAAAKSELNRVQREYQDKQITSQAEVRETESELQASLAALNAAQARLKRYQSADKEGAISQDQLQEVQLAVQQQQQTLQAAQAKLTSTQTALNPSDAQVAKATSQIAEAKATSTATLATLNQEKQALVRQKIEIDRQIDKDTKELRQTGTNLRQTVVTAPVDGIISQLNLRNIGQTVRPGEEIAQIVPSNANMVILASIPVKSIGKLEPGQTAQMRVSACPYSDYGTLKGTVTAIAPDAIIPQSNNTDTPVVNQQQGAAFYEVVIQPNKSILKIESDRCAIQLGMEGQVDITTKEETVMQFLLRKGRLTTNL